MRDLCDVAYALHVQRVEQEALAQGGSPGEARVEFDTALAAEPDRGRRVSPEQRQLRDVLGVA